LLSTKFSCPHDGYSYPEIEPRLFSFNSPYGACPECNGLGTTDFFRNNVCPVCNGARLRTEALNVFLSSNKGGKKNIAEVTALSVDEAKDFFDKKRIDVLHITEKEEEDIVI